MPRTHANSSSRGCTSLTRGTGWMTYLSIIHIRIVSVFNFYPLSRFLHVRIRKGQSRRIKRALWPPLRDATVDSIKRDSAPSTKKTLEERIRPPLDGVPSRAGGIAIDINFFFFN
ncbi:hypothetical protein PUN28_014287 [Cardiocondyla obscurior]|uniref:Uncharacterized protein n=1 Tax=Cardiocondyla obscurior TaxID=286306 RepID=A0AAW2F102_9HYME